jgi:hypothetical protein
MSDDPIACHGGAHCDVRHRKPMPFLYGRRDSAGRHALGRKLAHVCQGGLLRRVRFQPGGATGTDLAEAERR